MADADFSDFNDFGCERQQIVEFSRRVVNHVHLPNHKHAAGIFQIAVRDPEFPQHLHATAFEIIQVVGVVHTTLAVGLLVRDPYLQLGGGHGAVEFANVVIA